MIEGIPGAEPPRPRAGEGLLLVAFALATVLAVAVVLIAEERSALDDPVQKAARGEVTGTVAESLVRPDNLARVLDAIEGAVPSESVITSMRVDPVRVSATVRAPDDRRYVVTVDGAFETQRNEFGEGEDRGISPSRVEAAAPQRILAALREIQDTRPGDLEYTVLSVSSIDGDVSWTTFLNRGRRLRDRQWTAAADGSDVRRLGEPSREQRAERAKAEREQRQQRRAIERRLRCLRRADTAEEAARCR